MHVLKMFVTWAAIIRCRSTTSWQFGHTHSLQRHNFLWPLRQEITPWFRHRAHFGVRRKRFAFCVSTDITSSAFILINSSSKDILFNLLLPKYTHSRNTWTNLWMKTEIVQIQHVLFLFWYFCIVIQDALTQANNTLN